MATSAVTYTFSPGAVIYASRFNQNFQDLVTWDNAHAAATNGVHGVASGAIMGTAAVQVVTGKKTFSGADTILLPSTEPTLAQSVGLVNGLFRAFDASAAFYGVPADGKKLNFVMDDFDVCPTTTYATGPMGFLAAVSGAGASVTSLAQDSAHPGVIVLNSGTTNAGDAHVTCSGLRMCGSGDLVFEWLIKIVTLGTGGERFSVVCGLYAGAGSDGIWFAYADNVNSGKWQANCGASSASATIDTGVAPSAGVWTHLKAVVNAAGTSVQFYIDGAAVGSPVTTHIPTATGVAPYLGITKSVGTTARTVNADLYQYYYRPTVTR